MVWGSVLTSEAWQAHTAGVIHPHLELCNLEYGCLPEVVDWKYNKEMIILLALHVAEETLFAQLALLDKSLLVAVHDNPESSSHKHMAVWPSMPFDTDKSDKYPEKMQAKLDLITNIIWMDDTKGLHG